jgi:hypothetical protein
MRFRMRIRTSNPLRRRLPQRPSRQNRVHGPKRRQPLRESHASRELSGSARLELSPNLQLRAKLRAKLKTRYNARGKASLRASLATTIRANLSVTAARIEAIDTLNRMDRITRTGQTNRGTNQGRQHR